MARAILLLLAVLQAAPFPQTRPVTISGEVSAGKTFEREFEPNLIFRLSPAEGGWEIQVVPRNASPDADYSAVVTSPFRFFNPRYLFPSYGFTAKDIVDMKERAFRFVRNQRDYDRARTALEVILGWTPPAAGKTAEQAFQDAVNDLAGIPYCMGLLTILDSTIVPAAGAEPERIERIKFKVELCGNSSTSPN